jgi:hypothetical protein
MKVIWVVVLAVLAFALGAGGGFVGGFLATAIYRLQTGVELGCALLQTAQSAGYVSQAQRDRLVEEVLPPPPKKPRERDPFRRVKSGAWAGEWIKAQYENMRIHLKSGCP